MKTCLSTRLCFKFTEPRRSVQRNPLSGPAPTTSIALPEQCTEPQRGAATGRIKQTPAALQPMPTRFVIGSIQRPIHSSGLAASCGLLPTRPSRVSGLRPDTARPPRASGLRPETHIRPSAGNTNPAFGRIHRKRVELTASQPSPTTSAWLIQGSGPPSRNASGFAAFGGVLPTPPSCSPSGSALGYLEDLVLRTASEFTDIRQVKNAGLTASLRHTTNPRLIARA
jgi:hypothetical protein